MVDRHGNARAPTTASGAPDARYLNPKYPVADPAAAAFEAAIVEWIQRRGDATAGSATGVTDVTGADAARHALHGTALSLLPRALCCGYEVTVE